jgi:hypothetical protein
VGGKFANNYREPRLLSRGGGGVDYANEMCLKFFENSMLYSFEFCLNKRGKG